VAHTQYTCPCLGSGQAADVHSLERIVFQVQLALGHNDAGLGLALVCGAGHASHNVIVAVRIDDDAVFAQLLLDEDDLCVTPTRASTGSAQTWSARAWCHVLLAHMLRIRAAHREGKNARIFGVRKRDTVCWRGRLLPAHTPHTHTHTHTHAHTHTNTHT